MRANHMNAVLPGRGDGALALGEVPIPRPGRGEVLIKVAAAPINPSDLAFLAGASGTQAHKPVVPGLEGSGTVVSAGPGLVPRLLVGRRVAFATTQGGSWAEYAVCTAVRCIPLRRSVSLAQAAMMIVNPLTALAFFDIARRGWHGAIVSNAAASALGRMIVRHGRRRGVPVINIVRRPQHVEELRKLGAEYVLDSNAENFPLELRVLAHRLHATLFLDAVGGVQTQTFVDAAPAGSTIVAYAALAGEPSVFNARTLIGEDKTIVGFYLGHWTAHRGVLRTLRDIVRVQRLIGSDLQSNVHRRLSLSSVGEAVEIYRTNMTGGKVLLVADPSQVQL